MADGTVRAPVAVEFKAEGIESVRQGLRLVRGDLEESGASSEKFAMGARRASFALEEMARSGEVAGRGLRELLATGAEMAFSFGIGGPIVAAVAVLGLAFVDHFRRAREEIEKTRTQAITALEDIARSGDVTAIGRKKQYAYSGDPYAMRKPDESDAEFVARSSGLQGIRARIEELRATLPKEIVDQGGLGKFFRGSYATPIANAGQELRELIRLLGEYKRQIAEIDPIFARAIKAQNEIEVNALKAAREKAALQMPAEMTGFDDAQMKRFRDGVPLIGKLGDAFQTLRGQLAGEADVLMREFYAGTTTAERRLEIETKLAEILKQQAETAPRVVVPVPGVKGGSVDPFKPAWVDDMVKRWEQVGDSAAKGFVSTLAAGIRGGVDAALRGGGIGSIFAGIGGAITAGLGSIFEEIGTAALAGMAIMAKIKAAIIAFAPEVGIPLAIGLIAFGALLQGAGGRLGGGGSAGGYGGGSSVTSSLPQIIDRGFINPAAQNAGANVTPRASITMPILAVNPNDPATQRLIAQTQRNAERGGAIRGVGG